MKVFSLLSLGEIWEISRIKDRQSIHHLVWLFDASSISLHTGVGYCLFDTGFPEPLPDKRKMLHTFFLFTALWSIGQYSVYYEI